MTLSDISFIYNTNRNSNTDFDCFYAHITETLNGTFGAFLRTNHLTPYCRRLTSISSINEIEGNFINKIRFKDLRSQGIHSEELLEWSISIDIIEEYEIYLITNNTEMNENIFYNCSLLWFGSHCEYTFNLNISNVSFGDFIDASFHARKQYSDELIIHSCYPHLSECYRGPEPMCLDWREICDGKFDCIGDKLGIDEEYCEELEITECKENEYRCHNGAQCIPLEFFRDHWKSKDCLDGSDADDFVQHIILNNHYTTLECIEISTFSCEERSCRNPRTFTCGDGDCYSSFFSNNYIFPFTNICPSTKRELYFHRAITIPDEHISNDCYNLLFCKIGFSFSIDMFFPGKTFPYINCTSDNFLLLNNCSMDYIPFPSKPIFAGYFQLIYTKENLINTFYSNTLPNYVCNDPRRCLHLSKPILQIYGLDCRPFEEVTNDSNVAFIHYLYIALRLYSRGCEYMDNKNVYISNNRSLYYCKSSNKYISKHRLLDGVYDCYENEDEDYPYSCSLNDSQRHFCEAENICISPLGIGLALPNCINGEDLKFDQSERSLYPLLCDGILDMVIEDDEFDENNCEWWPCYTPYTRCDTVFQCANGIDEIDCPSLGCSNNELKCYNQNSPDHLCISRTNIYEKPIECSIDNDDKTICRNLFYSNNLTNNKNEYLSWNKKTCITKDDICNDYQSINKYPSLLCKSIERQIDSCDRLLINIDNNQSICLLNDNFVFFRHTRFFSIFNLGYLPSLNNITPPPTSLSSPDYIKPRKILSLNTSIELIEYCNRGIIIYEGKSLNKKCLCPPSYYGNHCQWQNQRISLTLQIYKLSSIEQINNIFDIFIYLIDDQTKIIQSYDKINFISSNDCRIKYNRYLLYPTKPKNLHTNYSIHIDIYDKITLNYYSSFYLSIPFQFLPINRISTQIIIPYEESKSLSPLNCSLECGNNGKCYNYINIEKSFCHCNEGYSGRYCNITSKCLCSIDSICLNSSICLCSLNKYGSKCYLKYLSCQPINPCQNNGYCIPIDHRINKYNYICLCKQNFMGFNCQFNSTKIHIYFKINPIPSLIFIHYITAFDDNHHQHTTTFKKIRFNYQSVTLSISQLFNILIIEYHNTFYLTVLREKYIPSEDISIDINNDNICKNISELFNSTILNNTILRQYKYYSLLCYENLKLKCFYDKIHICICDKNHFSNCFKFNHSIKYNCQGNNQCENNGKCFQDNSTCPQKSICMCQKCYYGNKCQLTTEGFSLSLDVIFGYHIKPFISFFKQSLSVKIITSLTFIMFIFGWISGSLSILVFKNKLLLEIGCGQYLFINSINSLLTINIFTIKYFQLLIFQMNIITNYSFIYLNCLLTDILLKIFLSTGDWLSACVAIERVFTAFQGINFNKSKSKSIAKRVIPIIFIVTIISYIHDPITRQLIEDKDEERIWCIVNYSSKLKKYDRFINLFHFLTPFIINIIFAIIIIIQLFKIHSKTKRNASHSTLYAEIKRHKHVIISPCILIILAFPRLFISFLSQCMESAHNPWLFLIGYYISFVPPLLFIFVFILPSEKYREKLSTIISKMKRSIRYTCHNTITPSIAPHSVRISSRVTRVRVRAECANFETAQHQGVSSRANT